MALRKRMHRPKGSRPSPGGARPRPTKKQRMIDMLRRPEGATVNQIAVALGWQPHTVRGYMTDVLRKKVGLEIVVMTERVYGIR